MNKKFLSSLVFASMMLSAVPAFAGKTGDTASKKNIVKRAASFLVAPIKNHPKKAAGLAAVAVVGYLLYKGCDQVGGCSWLKEKFGIEENDVKTETTKEVEAAE